MANETRPDDYLSIETPENVAFGYEIAGLASRFLAALIDTVLITLLQIVTLLGLVGVARLAGEVDASDLNPWVIAVAGLLAFAFYWGYYTFFEVLLAGQSPGKRWIGLRVIRRDGTPLTLSESIVRNLVRLVDFMPAYYGVGVVAMFVDGQTRRLGDLAAGTLVVRDKAAVTLESLAARPGPAVEIASGGPTLGAVSSWPVQRLSSADLGMVEDFLRRSAQLPNRAALAARILQALTRKLGLPAEAIDPDRAEEMLAEIVRARAKP
jgi:uncharacterized RDD family membrane protein YckC